MKELDKKTTMPVITPKTIKNVISGCFKSSRNPVFIWGPPGIGKSDCVRQAAQTLGQELKGECNLIDVRLSQLDPVDLRGIPSERSPLKEAQAKIEALRSLGEGYENEIRELSSSIADMLTNGYESYTKWCPPNFLPQESRDGQYGILFLDELSSANMMVQVAAYQLILDRRLGDYVLPDGWMVVAAGNREDDKAAVQAMSTALANRFTHFEAHPSFEDWLAWAYKANIHEDVIAYLRYENGIHLFEFAKDSDDKIFPTPRGWEAVSDFLHSNSNGTTDLLIRGRIGDAVGGHFGAFRSIRNMLPNLDKIVEAYVAGYTQADMDEFDPEIKFPNVSGRFEVADRVLKEKDGSPVMHSFTNSSKLYLMAVGLAARATEKNVDAMWTMSLDMEADYSVMFVMDAMKRCPQMKKGRGFKVWAEKHIDIINTINTD